MSVGVQVTSKNLGKTQDEIERMVARAKDLKPAMKASARAIETFIDDRFRKESGPRGAKWQALSPTTDRASEPGHKVLQRSGMLRNSAFGKAQKKAVRFGAAQNYAAYHQFSTTTLPERPFIPVEGSGSKFTAVDSGPSGKLWNRIRGFVANYVTTGSVRGKR